MLFRTLREYFEQPKTPKWVAPRRKEQSVKQKSFHRFPKLNKAEKHKYNKGMFETSYWNQQPIKIPLIYNQDNIICQWLSTHHTKKFKTDSEISRRVVQ